jgi:hypothetical protein
LLVHLNISLDPQGLKTLANAVAKPTDMSTTKGKNVKIPLSPLPRSGVISPDIHPIVRLFGSPSIIKKVTVNDVKE